MPKTPHPGREAVSSSFKGGWRALIALTDERVAERVLLALPPTVETTRVSPGDAMDAAGELASQLIFADLTDAETLQGSLGQSESDSVCPIVYLATADVLESRWADVARLRLCSLLDTELVGDAVIFEAAIAGTLGGRGFDVQSLLDSCSPVDVYGIESEPQRVDAVGRVLDRLQSTDLSPLQLTHYRLVVEEILNNAMRHAPSAGKNNVADCPDAGQSGGAHHVTLPFVVTPELFAVSVTDPAGALTADAVRHSISRQLAGAGDFDSGGRGLFIAYSLANLLGVTVEPGRRTGVVALFRHALPEAHKALIINSHADANGNPS